MQEFAYIYLVWHEEEQMNEVIDTPGDTVPPTEWAAPINKVFQGDRSEAIPASKEAPTLQEADADVFYPSFYM